jgi:hypothetical protein
VEPNGSPEAAHRAMLLGNIGVDVSSIADALNSGKTVTLTVPADVVPVPLSAAVWSDAILQRKVPPVELFAAILADDRAVLLCHGLAGLDDLTLQYLTENPTILRGLYKQAAVFSAFGSSLRIRDGRVVTPGEGVQAEAARAVWEDVVEAKTTEPASIHIVLFARHGGGSPMSTDARRAGPGAHCVRAQVCGLGSGRPRRHARWW